MSLFAKDQSLPCGRFLHTTIYSVSHADAEPMTRKNRTWDTAHHRLCNVSNAMLGALLFCMLCQT